MSRRKSDDDGVRPGIYANFHDKDDDEIPDAPEEDEGIETDNEDDVIGGEPDESESTEEWKSRG